MKKGVCLTCQLEVVKYGSIFDTGTIKTFIKVVFVDESKVKKTNNDRQMNTDSQIVTDEKVVVEPVDQ